jgi:hypothetical protein
MRDPYHPSAEEIEKWAYDADALEPVQDWDIIGLRDAPYRRLVMRLAKDAACPKKAYFLHVLYLTAGDWLRAVRLPEFQRRAELDAITHDLQEDGFQPFLTLAERIAAVQSGSLDFSYDLWCAGGYSRQEAEVQGTGPNNS